MDAIEKLKLGFAEFKQGYYQEKIEIYQELVDVGQHPKVAVIACSDSRVDPTTILHKEPGEVFIIRNVANLVPPYEENGSYHGTSAALEFAVQHLNVEHIIVLGHAYCGGIQTLFKPEGEKGEDTKKSKDFFLKSWVSMLKPAYLRVIATMPDATERQKHQACEQESVLVSLENLMTFACIRKRVLNNSLRLHGWYIDIKDGSLSSYDAQTRAFEKIV